ncbi:MAG: ABC transporter ATP-binding protein, partial [Bradyrhizobium sp.]|nr:ABC transporter ATP-binding protein [Bradyrhizobium sp.]
RRYTRKAERLETVLLKQIRLGSTFQSVREFLQTFFTEILVLSLGLFSYMTTGAPSIGQVMALRGYAKDARSSVDGVLNLYTDSKASEGATARVLQYLKKSADGDAPEAPALRVDGGGISLRGVTYRLSGQETVLSAVDMDIKPGEKVLVVGGSARMRQGLLDMMLRLDRPSAGQIMVDGQDIGGVTQASLQDAMALIQRRPLILPDETIEENLLFGNNRNIEDADILKALTAADAEFLLDTDRFPAGLDTQIDAERMTEGERQRLALARAVLRAPSVLLIDGVGSGLP